MTTRVVQAPIMRLAYLEMLVGALREEGCEVWQSNWFPRRGVLFGKKLDAVHLHMLDVVFSGSSFIEVARKIALFYIFFLPALRLRGIRLIWTCHEMAPHEGRFVAAIAWLNRRLCHLADHVVVHNVGMRNTVYSVLGSEKQHRVSVLPHGDLYPYYRRFASAAPVRLSEVGGDLTFLALGYMRKNKGNDLILSAFRELREANIRLVMCGDCQCSDYRAELGRLASGDNRIDLRFAKLSDQELVELHEKADVAVFGFRECQTSGSLVTALCLGKPVVAPRLGHVTELVTEEIGWTFDPEKGLEGIVRAFRAAIAERGSYLARGEAGRSRMAAERWDLISERLLEIYRGEVAGGQEKWMRASKAP